MLKLFGESNGGAGRVAFLSGAPGAGKSSLIDEFAARLSAINPDAVVAVGNCDAHTGIGDPYLPFLDLLNQLTGNVEAKLSQQAISEKSARRLRQIGKISVDLLIQYAPDLIGTVIPGSSLIVGVIRKAAESSGLLDKIKKPLEEAQKGIGGEIDQQRIIASYTALIGGLADRVPLVLVLDDLQWADAASCTLFFHLAQNLLSKRVLLIGTFRANDVAMGRGGDRHPLSQVLNELKRYRGDILIDLDAVDAASRRTFVSALVDREPNELDAAFREALYQHTNGHPLFTVELLRALQERGSIVLNERGRWTVGSDLDWTHLPSRVEGVIEERISRLQDDLRALLRVASVEGENFTVEILARLEELSERALLQKLSDELQRRHQLVSEGDVKKIGRKFISHYCFTHAIFQQYLYNELGRREKMMLHGSIAELLEQLYEGQADLVTVQLARHWALAGESEKAFDYSMRAARRALRISAYPEALRQLDDALALVPDLPADERAAKELDAQIGRSAALKATKGWDSPEVIAVYDRARGLGAQLGPSSLLAPVLFGYWAVRLVHLELTEALALADAFLAEGQGLHDTDLIMQARSAQENTRFWMGDFRETIALAKEATALFLDQSYIEHNGQDPRIFVLMFDLFARWITGDENAAAERRTEMMAQVDKLQHPFTTAIALQAVSWQAFHERDVAGALVQSARLIAISEKHQFPFYRAIGRLVHAWAAAASGNGTADDIDAAFVEMEAAGGRLVRSLAALMSAEARLQEGDVARGLAAVNKAIDESTAARDHCYLGELQRVRGELLLLSGDFPAGIAALHEAMETAQSQGAKAFAARAAAALERGSPVAAKSVPGLSLQP